MPTIMLFNGMTWQSTGHYNLQSPDQFEAAVGIIPTFISIEDERSVAEQINQHYISGWQPMKGFVILDEGKMEIQFKTPEGDDPPMLPIVFTTLRREIVLIYQYGITLIKQVDGSFEVARLD